MAVIIDPDQHFKANNNETQSLCNITFNERDFTESIKNTATNSGTRQNEIPAIIFKNLKKL